MERKKEKKEGRKVILTAAVKPNPVLRDIIGTKTKQNKTKMNALCTITESKVENEIFKCAIYTTVCT
jgi:hypothetical protein